MIKQHQWPQEVPVLKAGHSCRHYFTRGRRHCLAGWCDAAGLPGGNNPGKEIAMAIEQSARELSAHNPGQVLPSINDNPVNSRHLLARIWNRSMAKLGYRAGNPESRYVKAAKGGDA